MKYQTEMSWSLWEMYNAATVRPDRPTKPRDYLWASELGKSSIDIYLALQGEQPSNKPNLRSLHKFMAGDFWENNLLWFLTFAGILKTSQDHLAYQYDGLLKVTGKVDFIAGGVPDYEKGLALIKEFPMTEPVREFLLRFIQNMKARYEGVNLPEVVLECKSVGSFIFPRYERTGKPNAGHILQTFHYLKSQNRPEGKIAYFSKDDSMMLEFGVFNNFDGTGAEEAYKNRIEELTGYYKRQEVPALEKEIIFDEDALSFQKNWKIEYSNYLTKLYGYSEPEAYYRMWQPKAAQFNRAFKRVVANKLDKRTETGKLVEVTKANMEVLKEVRAYFPDLDRLVQLAVDTAKKTPSVLDESEEVAE